MTIKEIKSGLESDYSASVVGASTITSHSLLHQKLMPAIF
jgi:hypothetical protein